MAVPPTAHFSAPSITYLILVASAVLRIHYSCYTSSDSEQDPPLTPRRLSVVYVDSRTRRENSEGIECAVL